MISVALLLLPGLGLALWRTCKSHTR